MTARQEEAYRRRLHGALEAASAAGDSAAYPGCVAKVTEILDEIGSKGYSVSLAFGPNGARGYMFRREVTPKDDPFGACDLAIAAAQKALRDVPTACLGHTDGSIVHGGLDSAAMLLDWTRRQLAFARDVQRVNAGRKRK